MTILGIDTTTAFTTAGLFREGRVVAERTEPLQRKGNARSLPALVDAVLADAGVGVPDLDAAAVAVGPGSFTGIRLGLGFAKGLTFARGIPLVGVGTLEALAEAAGEPEAALAACLDARKGEVYLAFFEAGEPRRRSGEITALSPNTAAGEIFRRLPRGGIVVGDASGIYEAEFAPLVRARVRIRPFVEVHPRGGVIAEIAARQLVSQREAATAVSAVYVRPSAAEAARASSALTTPPGRS